MGFCLATLLSSAACQITIVVLKSAFSVFFSFFSLRFGTFYMLWF